MKIGGRFKSGRFASGRFASGRFGVGATLSYSVSIAGLTSNPTHGPTAQIGVELTASASGWSAAAPASVAWQWHDAGGAISGATAASYAPVAGLDLDGLYVIATPSDTYAPRSSAVYTVRFAPPTQNALPAASGAAVIGESLSGTAGTFTGGGIVATSEWQVSADGATDWTGTGDTDLTGPAMASGQHYRLATTATNSGGSLTTYSASIGPAAAPVITMAGLTGSEAVSGSHASITMAASAGTITARKWGSSSGGAQYGTGTNPTDFAAGEGGTLYATATVGGIDYTLAAPIVAGSGVGITLVELGDGTAEFQTTETHTAVTISGSNVSAYNTTHGPVALVDLDSGPVNTLPMGITGGTVNGEDFILAYPGFWFARSDVADPVFTYQWQRNGVAIAGATGLTYTRQAVDEGTTITCIETSTNALGTRSQVSNGISIEAAPGANYTDTFDQTDGTVLQDLDHYTGYGTWASALVANGGAAGYQTAAAYSGGVHYNVPAIGADQSCEFALRQFGVTTSVNMEAQGVVRATGSSDGYRLTVLFRASLAPILRLKKGTSILAATVLGSISVDDEYRISAVGSTITVERKPAGGAWGVVWSGTDTDYADGDPGIHLAVATTATTLPLFEYATFSEVA